MFETTNQSSRYIQIKLGGFAYLHYIILHPYQWNIILWKNMEKSLFHRLVINALLKSYGELQAAGCDRD